MSDRHLTPEDLAEREGVSLQTVYHWNKTGGGPRYMKIGTRCRYRLADVKRALAAAGIATRPTASA